ncbi:MAG TPA: hypothetical protein VGF56_16155 [Rhizomicrobium sp.]|jgi:hypothetical protein
MAKAPPDDPASAPDSASAPASPSETSDAPEAGAAAKGAARKGPAATAELRDADFAAESAHAELHDRHFTHMAETAPPHHTEAALAQSAPHEDDVAAKAVSSLNRQITDALAAIEVVLRTDMATGLQLASDMAATQAAALAMFNAVQAQQRDSMLANAAMARTLSRLVALSRAPAAATTAAPPSQEKPNV